MRIYFKSMARPKRVAKSMQDVFPLEKLSQCQAWTAQIYGYRDWHELERVTVRGEHPPSPDDEDLSMDELVHRSSQLDRQADDVLGLDLLSGILVHSRLNTTSRKPTRPALRFKDLPAGENPLYCALQVDLLNHSGEGSAFDDGDFKVYSTIPAEYGPTAQVKAALLRYMRRRAKVEAAACDEALKAQDVGVTRLYWEKNTVFGQVWAQQQLREQYFLFDHDNWPVAPVGFIDLELQLSAESDSDFLNSLVLQVNQAWAPAETTWILGDVVSSLFSAMVARLCISLRSTEEAPLSLDLRLTNPSGRLKKGEFLEFVRELAAEAQHIPEDDIKISYV